MQIPTLVGHQIQLVVVVVEVMEEEEAETEEEADKTREAEATEEVIHVVEAVVQEVTLVFGHSAHTKIWIVLLSM